MEAVVSSGIKRSLTQSPNDSGRLLSILFTTEHSTLCVVLFVVFCFKMKNRRIEAYWTEISKKSNTWFIAAPYCSVFIFWVA